jgi:NADPH2:quinone reductase
VEAVGEGVTAFAAGDRVAYTSGNYGAYADQRLIDAGRLVRLPDDIDDVLVAGMMVRGLTARILLTDVFPVGEGSVILVQAAAGGVGQLLCQWARHLGATVIGTVGSQEKAERARKHGCHHVILYREQNVVDTVKQLTDGRGVDVAYDSVGKDTFYDSLACLAPRGHLVNFGQSSGPVEPLAMPRLAAGSFTVVRPMLGHYTANPADRDAAADAFFQALRDGILAPDDPVRYALQDVGQAHDDMEARRTHGAVVLIP